MCMGLMYILKWHQYSMIGKEIGDLFQNKDRLSRYGYFHYKDKTACFGFVPGMMLFISEWCILSCGQPSQMQYFSNFRFNNNMNEKKENKDYMITK